MSKQIKKERACIRCGCTEDCACAGGCEWVAGCNVCSACLTKSEQAVWIELTANQTTAKNNLHAARDFQVATHRQMNLFAYILCERSKS